MEDEEPVGERATPLIPNVIQWNLKKFLRKRDLILKVLALFLHIHCTQVSTVDRTEFRTSDESYMLFSTRNRNLLRVTINTTTNDM